METVTTRVESDTYDEIQDRSEGEKSKSAVTRELIRRGIEAEQIEAERDRLDRQLKQLIEQRDETTELVEYVEQEHQYRTAPVWKRAKWWLKGAPA
jgi:hypothetical protein